VSFVITQKEENILNLIRDTLNIGGVILTKEGYYRYTVSSRPHIAFLIKVFNGKLRLNKCQVRFKL